MGHVIAAVSGERAAKVTLDLTLKQQQLDTSTTWRCSVPSRPISRR
jgi:hypothetical protein